MTLRISTPARNAAVDGIVDRFEDGSASTAKLQLRTGTVPTNLTDAAAGTLLVEFALPDPAFGAGAVGVATANAITPVVGAAAGVIGHYRVIDQDGTPVLDSASVGVGSGELQVNTLTVSVGVDVTVNSWTITVPAS